MNIKRIDWDEKAMTNECVPERITIDGTEYELVPVSVEENLPTGYVSPNFRESEFACNHCGALGGGPNMELVEVLERLRADLGDNPVTVTSGYRCSVHNTNVGSTETSQHRKATAADIQVKNVSPQTVHAYCIKTYPYKYGIGRYDSFTHIDVREKKARW